MLARLDRLPAQSPGRTSRLLWLTALLALGAGIVSWAIGGLGPGVTALWCFTAAAVALGLVLPLPYALVSPLFMGVAGWLVDMLPFVILAGWTAVVLRWVYSLVVERRLPRGGRWVWIPVGLLFWTGLGVLVITSADFKHFLLLLGVQFVITGALLAVVDQIATLEDKTRVISGLVAFTVLLSSAVFLEWIGVPVQDLQDGTARRRVEAAYGVDAFPNAIGMIKYARSKYAGALELRRELERVADASEGLPPFVVFRPKFEAYENQLIVRFEGSARGFEATLAAHDVGLLYDNIGISPANTVPRLRSFPRNALTFAGVSAALLPFAFYLAWTGAGRRRRIGQAGVVACLFGAGTSLARGAWVAIVIGIVYLWFDGRLGRRRKLQVAGAFVAAAVALTVVYFVAYEVDPLTGRAGGLASVTTRDDLYRDTLAILKGKSFLLGYGTERPRTESGTVKEGARYVPRAGTHSTYLNYLFRLGVPGLAGIVALYLLAGLHARAAARERDGREGLLFTMTAMSMAIVGAHAVILSLYVEPIYTLTVALLLALAIAGATNLRSSVLPWRARAAA